MNKIFLIPVIVLLTFGCGQADPKKYDNKDSSTIHSSDNHSDKGVNWYDELIINYIKKSDNELIKSSRADTAIKIEWLLDRLEDTDTAKYLIFHIGHDVVDKGNSNKRFVTDAWVYIDSLSRKFYEYDLPNDSLIEWKK